MEGARANGPERPWLILNVSQRKMIDREARDSLAEKLRQLASGGEGTEGVRPQIVRFFRRRQSFQLIIRPQGPSWGGPLPSLSIISNDLRPGPVARLAPWLASCRAGLGFLAFQKPSAQAHARIASGSEPDGATSGLHFCGKQLLRAWRSGYGAFEGSSMLPRTNPPATRSPTRGQV